MKRGIREGGEAIPEGGGEGEKNKSSLSEMKGVGKPHSKKKKKERFAEKKTGKSDMRKKGKYARHEKVLKSGVQKKTGVSMG